MSSDDGKLGPKWKRREVSGAGAGSALEKREPSGKREAGVERHVGGEYMGREARLRCGNARFVSSRLTHHLMHPPGT